MPLISYFGAVTGIVLEESGAKWHQPILDQKVLDMRTYFRCALVKKKPFVFIE